MTERPEDQPIGMDFHPTKTVRDLTMVLARTVSDQHGTHNGPTALYWAIMAVVAGHARWQAGTPNGRPSANPPEGTL